MEAAVSLEENGLVPWPPDPRPEIARRLRLLARVRSDRRIRVGLCQHYQFSPVDFIGDWVWTYDPRCRPSWLPFVPWDKQIEYLGWLLERVESKEDGLVEKSRDAGVTWLNAAFSLWMWRFIPGSKVGFGSRKQDLVDKIGDPDSIFEKLRMAVSRIPVEMLPVDFDIEKHSSFMRLINPETGSTITGEAGDNIGRGGRNTIYFKDESAFYERPRKIEAALSQNTDVQIDVSTPNGVGNPFHIKRMGGKVKVFTFNWRDDPRKNEAWYKRKQDTLDPIILAQEIDIDYGASAEGVVIPSRWIQAAINFKLSKTGIKMAGLDVADEGADSNALSLRHGVVVYRVDEWKKGNTTQTARRAFATCRDEGVLTLKYDSIGVGAGVKGEMSQLPLGNMVVVGINSGSTHLPGWYELPSDHDKGKKNEDMFLNLKAKNWWLVRRRFEKTWEQVNGVKNHDPDDLISIPNDPQLIMELGQPKYIHTDAGKIKVIKKSEGERSPNKADALIISFADPGSNAGVW